jgi:type IV secretion system protein VirB4
MDISQRFKSKSSSAKPHAPDKATDVTQSDFIPYASFVDENTILTKNGELLQTIKISHNVHELPTEDATTTGVYLRDAVRNALKHALGSQDFSMWLHTTRDRTPLKPLSAPNEPFADRLQGEWLSKQHTKFVYHNVCYLTLLIAGQGVKLFKMKDFKESASINKNRQYREQYISNTHEKLQHAMEQMQRLLGAHFKVEPLAFVARQASDGSEAFFSEQMEFFHRIINLSTAPMPVKKTDISSELATHEMIFGFDALETKAGKHKRFASLVSLKHYHELPSEVLDSILQMPVEMLITQTFDFIPAKQALQEVNDIGDVLKRSKDGYVAHASGFIGMLEANQGSSTDFGEQQTTFMLMTDYYQELDHITTELQSAIAKIGLVSVREDIKFEEIFWSQLPGNFEFIRRRNAIPTNKACGLARLNYYPIGATSSRWGEPITIFPTATKAPYLFHFHEGNSGHTVLVDYNSFPDALSYRLTHFFAAVTSKQSQRIIMFDRHASGEMFTNAMHGRYLRLGGKQHNLGLNPLAMPCTPQNQGFLAAWMAALLEVSADDAAARQSLKDCVAQGWTADGTQGFASLVQTMQRVDATLASKLQAYLTRAVFSNCFASGMDNFMLDHPLTSINLHKDCFTENSHFAAFALMLHRIILTLDGAPTLIIVKEAWDVFSHPFFASRLSSLFEMLTEKNAVLFCSTRDVDGLVRSNITKDMLNVAATKIFMPDDIASDYARDLVGLSEAEDTMLLKMERQRGDILIKHGSETIPTRFKIDNADLQAILMGDAKTLHGMRIG